MASTPSQRAGGRLDTGNNAGAVLTVDLGAIAHNYGVLRAQAPGAEIGAVLKADAYGLGLEPVAKALRHAGCQSFFTATVAEAARVREIVPDAHIYALASMNTGTAAAFAEHNIRPGLASLEQVREWAAYCKSQRRPLPAALHVETGMNRYGLKPDELDSLINDKNCLDSHCLDSFEISLLMAHLACADEPDHPQNQQQLNRFLRIKKHFPGVPASLANSGGILLGPDYHFDMVRPGLALYGENPHNRPISADIKPVVRLEAFIGQIFTLKPGDNIGYGATFTCRQETKIAVISVGYADGFFRALGGGENNQPGLTVFIGGHKVPVIGRISMDMATLDVSAIADDQLSRGTPVELIGPHSPISEVAKKAGTIAYEILTSLGNRYDRRYI